MVVNIYDLKSTFMIESNVKSKDHNKVDAKHQSIFSIQTLLEVPYSLIQTTKSMQVKLLKIFLTYNKYNSLISSFTPFFF